MVRRLTGNKAVGALQLSKETGVNQQNLWRWLTQMLKRCANYVRAHAVVHPAAYAATALFDTANTPDELRASPVPENLNLLRAVVPEPVTKEETPGPACYGAVCG